ncbi:hypothetical protein GHT06_006347 [Daphnia sinensis]|uniref:Uncharacterized protein n=1 Tax=Daphnia sinensis TaxID=1820382 RepID=A0AAD5KUU4_9CRUS|nr:hypothetical protein GHT06_006347 [Daphnia sinensis]
MDPSDSEKPSLNRDGRVFTQERDPFGTIIWVDQADLNCYKLDARGAPPGSLTCHGRHILRNDNCRHIRLVCGVGPGEVHTHRDPEPREIRYLKALYHARVYLARTGSMAGLTAEWARLARRYQLGWLPEVLYDSMKDLGATCARLRRLWRGAPAWNEDRDERRLYRRRRRATRRHRRAARAARNAALDGGAQTPESVGEGAQTPEPVDGGVQTPEPIDEGAQDPEPLGEGIQAPEPIGEGVPTPEPIGEGAWTPEPFGEGIQAPEPIGEGVPTPEPIGEGAQVPEPIGVREELQDQVPAPLEVFDLGAWVEAEMPTPVYQEVDFHEMPTPPYRPEGVEGELGAQDPVPMDIFDFDAWVEAELPVLGYQDIDIHEMPTPLYQPEGPNEDQGFLNPDDIDAIFADLDDQ